MLIHINSMQRRGHIVMESTSMSAPTNAPRPGRRRVRAVSTTIAFVLASVVLEFTISFLVLVIILPLVSNAVSFNGQAFFAISYFAALLVPVAPAAMGGMYWLALRELQHNRVRIVWLKVTGIGLAFFLVTSALTNMIDIAAGRIIYANYYYTHDERYSAVLQGIAQYPYLVLVALVLALFFAIVIVNIARFFTKQYPADAHLPATQSWRDIGAIWGLTTFIIFASSISQLLISNYLASLGSSQVNSLPLFIALIVLIYFFIPSGIVAAIACADTLRSLQNLPAATIPSATKDPFASSDGSFSLSFSPITEND